MRSLLIALLMFPGLLSAKSEDLIQVTILSVEQAGSYGELTVKVVNKSNMIVNLFADIKFYGKDGSYITNGRIIAQDLGVNKESVDKVSASNLRLTDVKSWTFTIEFPTSVKDAKGNSIYGGEKTLKIADLTGDKLPLKNNVTVAGNSKAGSCNPEDAKADFYKNCRYAGILKAESGNGKIDMPKIETVCRCLVSSFRVEEAARDCAFDVNMIRSMANNDRAKLSCGSY